MFPWNPFRGRPPAEPIAIVLDRDAHDGGGTAALAMVLIHHGHDVTLDELRPRVATEENGGCSALTIIEAARGYGLVGEGIRLDARNLDRVVPRGSILHWDADTFVVYDGLQGLRYRIIDPTGGGLQKVRKKVVRRRFRGVALVFAPQ